VILLGFFTLIVHPHFYPGLFLSSLFLYFFKRAVNKSFVDNH
jgi:hypothetical protein